VSRYIVLDLESHAIPDAATYLTEPVDAPSNYKDPEKIAAYIKDAKQAQLDKAALDIDLARIVCLGMQFHGETVNDPSGAVMGNVFAETFSIKDQTQERTILGRFFDNYFRSHNTADWPILVTFNGLGFDLPLLLRRALYLGVKAPNIQIDRFKHPHVIDLMDMLSYSGKMKPHSLSFYCQRFGIQVDDENSGKDISALIAADNWAAVEAHCASDVQATYALAKRMGVLA
jgi:predicted PolB exonuclease-like 3'-5' exonuclease